MFNRFRKTVLLFLGLSIPIQGFALDLVAIRATPFKVITAVLFVLAGVQYATRTGARPFDRKNLPMIAFSLSYVIAIVTAIIGGAPAVESIRATTSMVALISFYFLLSFAVQDRDDVVLLLWSLVVGGVVTVLPAAFGFEQRPEEFAEGARAAGLSGQENLLGADMNVCFAIAAGLFFMNRKTFRRAFLVGAGLLAIVGIALSLSRSAFVALGLMWLFWVYRTGRRGGGAQYAIIAVVVGLVSLMFVPDSVVRRAKTMINPAERAADASIQGRFLVNGWALRAFISSPVVGVGVNRFAYWVHEQPDPEARKVPWHSVHNAYLSILAEQGLFGMIPFLLLIVLSWNDYTRCWLAVRSRRLIGDPDLEELGTIALFLQLALLSGIVVALFHQEQRSKSFWMLMALSPVMVALVQERLAVLHGPGGAELGSEAGGPLGEAATRPSWAR